MLKKLWIGEGVMKYYKRNKNCSDRMKLLLLAREIEIKNYGE